MKKIVVIGSSNVDTTLHVKDFPKPGETISALEVTQAGGGKGANQVIAAAKAGSQTYFISRVGGDSEGDFMRKALNSYGVKTEYLEATPNANTGHAYINLNEAGQNNIVIDHGANYELSTSDIEAARNLIEACDCVIAQFETPLEATIAAFKLAKAADKMTILNPAPALAELPQELLDLTDLITPNETEAAAISGIEIDNDTALAACAEEIRDRGVENVIITYGAKGSYLSNKEVNQIVPAFKVKAVDTTAAGDTFIGYLAANLKADFSNLVEAATIASRASSLAVQRLGAQPSIPTANEVQEAMEE